MAYISFQPNDYFNTKLYTGNGSTQSITGVGFAPDMVWTKKRSATDFHAINDKVRGALKIVFPNTTDAEDTSSGCLTSFDSDGFSLGSNSGFNANTATFASWNWLANGQGSSNTDGSINTTYTSANTTSGFSISTYTGTGSNATVGHGLGVKPSMIICKRLNSTGSWITYHSSLGATKYLYLNATDASATNSTVWQDTEPTTSVFSVGTASNCNASGGTYICYAFSEKQGFSKFSSFVGTGSSDGPFLYCGFKPAFIIIKNADDGSKNWVMLDNKRPSTGQNPADDILFPNTSGRLVDFVSNGVKIRATSLQMNGSGNTHIFMAFSEESIVSSNGVPATAR